MRAEFSCSPSESSNFGDDRAVTGGLEGKQIEVDGEKRWLYAAMDTDSKLLLEIDVFSRRGTDLATAFLYRLTEKHDLVERVGSRRC